MQSKTHAVALAGIATAISILCVTLGNFVPMFDFAFYYLASVALLLPICFDYTLMGFLAYLVTAIVGLFLGGLRHPYYIFFCSFFGIQPLFSSLLQKLKWHKIFGYICECILFLGAIFLTYFVAYKFLLKSPIVWINNLGNWIYLILIAIGIPLYSAYSFFMRRIAKRLKILLMRISKKDTPKTEVDLQREKIEKIDPFAEDEHNKK